MTNTSAQSTSGRSRFDHFAEASSRFVSQGPFFGISLLLVILWMPTILVFHSVDTWQLVINTATSVAAFLLVALLQNSERRKDEATLAKLNTLAAAPAAVMRHVADGDREALSRQERELRASIGLEKRI
jgi:low affinity Fe/Cu permease